MCGVFAGNVDMMRPFTPSAMKLRLIVPRNGVAAATGMALTPTRRTVSTAVGTGLTVAEPR